MFQSGSGAGPSSLSRAQTIQRSTLLCFSHLRWGFVYQRPQHLLTRAARHFRVLFVEEPVFEDSAPRLDLSEAKGGVTVAVPVLPHRMGEDEAEAAQRELLDDLLARQAAERTIFWYYTPM